jgi:hypothetical protein
MYVYVLYIMYLMHVCLYMCVCMYVCMYCVRNVCAGCVSESRDFKNVMYSK